MNNSARAQPDSISRQQIIVGATVKNPPHAGKASEINGAIGQDGIEIRHEGRFVIVRTSNSMHIL